MTATLVILSYDDPEYRHVVAERPTTNALAVIDRGVNINLNHAEYYTVIEEEGREEL